MTKTRNDEAIAKLQDAYYVYVHRTAEHLGQQVAFEKFREAVAG